MAILRISEIRKLSPADANKRLSEISLELAKERANINLGSSAKSPGKIREMRKAIARLKTVRGQQ